MEKIVRYRNYNRALVDRSRKMRKEPTRAENKLWHQVLKHLPVRFVRQRVIGHYIADFYCAELKLVIEVDGSVHNSPEQQAYDAQRTAFLESLGLSVLRFTNSEVTYSLHAVSEKIQILIPSK